MNHLLSTPRELVIILLSLLAMQTVKAQDEPAFWGTWECVNCDADRYPKFYFSQNGSGKISWADGDYIQFGWVVNRNANQQAVWMMGETGSMMSGVNFCQIIVSQTDASHCQNQYRQFGNYGINFTCQYSNGEGAVMIEPHNIWQLKPSPSGTTIACHNTNPTNPNQSTTTQTVEVSLDPTVIDLLNQASEAAANGNNTALQNIINQIMEIAQQAYPDFMDQIKKLIDDIKAKKPTTNKKPATSAANDFPEGWNYLKQYQKLLNEYIVECKRAAAGGNTNRLIALATELANWVDKNAAAFARFTPAQSEALTKMTEFFSDALMKCATGTLQNMPEVHIADEAEQQNNFVPDIKTGATYYTPAPQTPTAPMSNGDLGNGNGMLRLEDPRHDTGPTDAQKRKPQ